MSILNKLTTQQVVALYNVFAAKNGTANVKKFRDAETGKKRLQDISRGLDHSAVVAAMKKAKIPADVIKLLPKTPTTIAIPEVPAPTPVVEAKKGNAAEVLEKERSKEKKQQAILRKEIRLTDGCAEVFRALRTTLKKKDDEVDSTTLAKQLKTSPTAIIKSVEKLIKMNLVKIEDDSPSDDVKLWYISLTRDGLSASVPAATTTPTAAAPAAAKKAALPADKPGPRSGKNGKRIYKLVEGNPRREGTHGHRSFSLIKDGMSYEQYKQAGGRNNDLAWDINHNYLEIR